MAVGDQQHRGVAVTVAAVPRGGDQALDLIERKVFPRAQLGIWTAPSHVRRNCLFFGGWHDQRQVRVYGHPQRLPGDHCLYKSPITNSSCRRL